MKSHKLVLASASPRRQELLRLLKLKFEVIPSLYEETPGGKQEPAPLVINHALGKAQEVAKRLGARTSGTGGRKSMVPAGENPHIIILGADTVVVLDGDILGKPRSSEDACLMLQRLQGRWHEVYTGVAVLADTKELTGYEATRVRFCPLSNLEIKSYVQTGEPLDKAGAYALQGIGSAFVERIEGCFTNVIGLPLPLTMRLLKASGAFPLVV